MLGTKAMVKSYAENTRDYNPLHIDEKFTSKTRFDGLICQGGIITGLLHALLAMDMPGLGTVFPRPELELSQACVHRRYHHS